MNDLAASRHGAFGAGARTPEELETLLEDALLLRDPRALAELFEAGAVFSAGASPTTAGHGAAERSARGGADIARLALMRWPGGHNYVADPQCVMQARDLALMVARRGFSVMRRGNDGTWRYAIVRQSLEADSQKETKMTQDAVQAPALQPAIVAKDQGQAWWWFSSLAVIKATAADTGGQLSIIEITEPPGMVGPLHVHHREDEAFWILEGEATFEVGGVTIEARAGDYVYGPRDIPHRYSTGPAGCRLLFIFTPGGFENLIAAMSQPAASRTLPPPSTEEPDWAQIAAIAKAYGNELLE